MDSDGGQLGIVPLAQAMKMAEERDLDLVRIAPQASPPVCKIMDYGKYKFEQQKREKEARKNQKVVEIKEIRLSVNIGVADFNTKLGHAKKFLGEGNKVKASIRFRGRERAHASLGNKTMERFAAALEEDSTVEKEPKLEGRSMQMILAPKAVKEDAKATKEEPKAAKEEPKAAKEAPKAAKEEPKAAKEAPKAAKEEPKTAKEAPKVAKEAPKKENPKRKESNEDAKD